MLQMLEGVLVAVDGCKELVELGRRLSKFALAGTDESEHRRVSKQLIRAIMLFSATTKHCCA
jgi:hypothetical protein